MTDNLANAGTDAAASGPISGDTTTTTTTAPAAVETAAPAQKSGFEGAFERAQATVEAGKPAQDRQEAARGADGKFAATVAQDSKAAPTGQPEALKAPERWPTERKELFGTLPRHAQEAWLTQQKEFDQGFQRKISELMPHQKFAEQVRQGFTPEMRAAIQQSGMDEASAVRAALTLVDSLNRDPQGTMERIAKARGINFQSQSQGHGQQPDVTREATQFLAPILQPLQAEIQALRQRNDAHDRAQAQHASQQTEATITKLVQEVDDTGSPKFPHLSRVADHMAQLVESDPRYRAMDTKTQFQTAYEAAVFADPELREQFVTAEAQKRFQAMEQAKSGDRLRAASTIKPSASATGTHTGPKGLEGAFHAARKQLGV
jgi:hypothetical protein